MTPDNIELVKYICIHAAGAGLGLLAFAWARHIVINGGKRR